MPTVKDQIKKWLGPTKRPFDLVEAMRLRPPEEMMEEHMDFITRRLKDIRAYARSIPSKIEGLSMAPFQDATATIRDIEITVANAEDELERLQGEAAKAEDKYAEAYRLIQKTHVRCPQYGWQEVVHAMDVESPEILTHKGDPYIVYQRLWYRLAEDGREIAMYQKVKMEDLRNLETGRGYDTASYCKGCGAEVREVANPRKWQHWHPNINWK